jgi:DNA invertase Pin-like site-specific DNA recombinase
MTKSKTIRISSLPFDVYVRVSKVDGREGEQYGSPEVQEAACREWAERHLVEVDEVVVDEDASGALDADERLLGALIRRAESGLSAGVLVRHLDRFGRGMIAGSVALKRLADAGGRLVAVEDGFDSASQGSKMVFQMRMIVAEDYLDRVSANFVAAQQRAAKRGVYLAARPPLGYLRLDKADPTRNNADGLGGKLTVDPVIAPLVSDAFKKRAAGESVNTITRWLNSKIGEERITTSGMRKVLANRAYLGEATVQTGKRGQPHVIEGAHEPLVTPALFESAQASNGRYEPRTGIISEKTHLLGIARCASCGQNLHGSASGQSGKRRAYYVCTGPKPCPHRASVSADALNKHVWLLLSEAVADGHEGIAAIIEGGDAHGAAVQAVEDAQEELALFVETTSVRDLGQDAWARGKESRQVSLDLARKELRNHKPDGEGEHGWIFGVRPDEETGGVVDALHEPAMREAMRLLVRTVEVGPSTRSGPRPSVADRTSVSLAGDGDHNLASGRVVVTSRLRTRASK